MHYLEETEGLDLSPLMMCLWSLLNIIQLSIMTIIFSFMIAFPETRNNNAFLYARIGSIGLYCMDMTMNFIAQRYEIASHKRNLKQIITFYVTN